MENRRRTPRTSASNGSVIRLLLIGILSFAVLVFPFRHGNIIAKFAAPAAFADDGGDDGDGGGHGGDDGHGGGGHGDGQGGDSGHGGGRGGDDGHGSGHADSGRGGKGEGHGGKGASDSGRGGGQDAAGQGGDGEGHAGPSGLSDLGGFQGLSPLSAQEEAALVGNWGAGPKK